MLYLLRGRLAEALTHIEIRLFTAAYVAIAVLGAFAFAYHYGDVFVSPGSSRTPGSQFMQQTSMMLLFIAEFLALCAFFASVDRRQLVGDLLPSVVAAHIAIFLLEGIGVFRNGEAVSLAWFRGGGGQIDRPSGLMSEPAYWGAFAATYSLALLFNRGRNKAMGIVLALVLLILGALIQAKTMFPAAIAGFAYIVASGSATRQERKIGIVLIGLVILGGISVALMTAAANVDENLSTAMRLGSTLLAWNVAASGLGFVGVGTGQFHFFFTREFAPSFLLLSNEAQDLITGVSESRASTFNLPIRYLVEDGVLGLAVAAGIIFSVVRRHWSSADAATRIAVGFIVTSVFLLLTQDSYCYPLLAFGLALAVTESSESGYAIIDRTR